MDGGGREEREREGGPAFIFPFFHFSIVLFSFSYKQKCCFFFLLASCIFFQNESMIQLSKVWWGLLACLNGASPDWIIVVRVVGVVSLVGLLGVGDVVVDDVVVVVVDVVSDTNESVCACAHHFSPATATS